MTPFRFRSLFEAPERAEPARPWTRWQRGALAGVMATSLALGWMIRLPALGPGEDEIVYLLVSESLAEGQFRDLGVPGAPLHAKYPPGTSAWILLVRTLTGGSIDAVRAGNLILLVVAGLLLADAVRRLGHPWIGVGAAAIMLWNPNLLSIATTLNSESLYIALSVAAIWATLAVGSGKRPGPGLVVACLAIAGFLTRTAGLGLLAGIGAWALVTRRWRFAVTFGITAGAVVVGWLAYLRWAMERTVAPTYAADLPNVLNAGPMRFARAAFGYGAQVLPTLLEVPTIAGTPVDNVIHLLILWGAGLVGFAVLIRRWPASAWTLLAGAAILVAWGWPGARFLLPLLPWIAVAVLLGSASLGSRLPPRYAAGRRLPLVLGVALTIFALQGSMAAAQAVRACRAPDQFATPGCIADNQRAVVLAGRALGDAVPADAVVATVKPSLVHYLSRRTVVPLASFARSASLDQVLSGAVPSRGATHLLLTPLTGLERGPVASNLLARCRDLAVAAHFPLGSVLLTLGRAGTSPDACEALRAFRAASPPLPLD